MEKVQKLEKMLEEMLESLAQISTGDVVSEKLRMSLGTAQADARDAVHNYIFKRGGRIPRAHQAWYKKMCEDKAKYRVGMAMPCAVGGKGDQTAEDFMFVDSYPQDADYMHTRVLVD